MNGTAPIYFFGNGEADGPHDCFDVEARLEEGEIPADTLASIEGMKGWRSVLEAVVWSKAKLLELVRPEAARMIDQLANYKLQVRDVRVEIKQLLRRQNILRDAEALGKVLQVNAELQRQHLYFEMRDQSWSPTVCDAFPALELYPLGPQAFPRDWVADWQIAGGMLFDGRMIARKDDPVWLALSDFGFPFPPFSMDVGFWTRDVDFDETERLGIFSLDDVIRPLAAVRPFTPIFTPPSF